MTTPGYCWYNNNVSYKSVYGALYNWYSVNTAKLCPTGWHVPTDAQWTTLATYLGGESVAGGKLKEAGTTHGYRQIPELQTVVVLQLFRVVIVMALDHTTSLVTTVTGGVLHSTLQLLMPGIGAYPSVTPMFSETSTKSDMVSLFAVCGIINQ